MFILCPHRLVEEYHIAKGENPATPESGQLITAAIQKNVEGGGRVRGVEGMRCPCTTKHIGYTSLCIQ